MPDMTYKYDAYNFQTNCKLITDQETRHHTICNDLLHVFKMYLKVLEDVPQFYHDSLSSFGKENKMIKKNWTKHIFHMNSSSPFQSQFHHGPYPVLSWISVLWRCFHLKLLLHPESITWIPHTKQLLRVSVLYETRCTRSSLPNSFRAWTSQQ